MRPLRLFSIALVLTLHGDQARPVHAGGVEKVLQEDIKYEPVRLPLSAKSARTWIMLRETMVKPLPDKTPFVEIIRSLKNAPRGKDGQASPLTVYLDGIALQEAEMTMATPIASPFLGNDEVPLHTYLGFILRPFRLVHRVHDGLVIIETECDDCPFPVEVSAAEAWTWLLLHEEVPLHFPDETPLEEVVKAIRRQTLGKGPGGRGLVIHFDPLAMRDVKKTPGTTVTFEIDQVPLCTALGLLLKPLGLRFHVGDDGVVVVASSSDDENGHPLMDVAEAVEGYQFLRYDLFWERHTLMVAPGMAQSARLTRDRARRQPAK